MSQSSLALMLLAAASLAQAAPPPVTAAPATAGPAVRDPFTPPAQPTVHAAPDVHLNDAVIFSLEQGPLFRQIQAVERAQTAASFYDYFSASSHTGLEEAFESKVFLYRDTVTGSLSLFFTHGIDETTSGIPTPFSRVFLDLDGVPPGAFVAASDDPNTTTGCRTGSPPGPRCPELDLGAEPEGYWTYANNTDGGVIDGLTLAEPWCVTITPVLFESITSWVYHFASGDSIDLDLTEPVTICYEPPEDVEIVLIDEGSEASLSGYFDDLDATETHDASWDFGDGSTQPASFTPGPGATHHDVEPIAHEYHDDGDYPVVLSVDDSGGLSGSASATVRVANLPPQASIAPPGAAVEGASVSFVGSATDPGSDDLTFTWDFGDGSPPVSTTVFNDGVGADPFPSSAGAAPFAASDSVSHSFGDDGTYEVTLTVLDDDGGEAVATVSVTVANAPPTVTLSPTFSAVEGAAAGLSADATDPGSDDLTFSWDFGDGGPGTAGTHFNDGVGPDPFPSPAGPAPFSASDAPGHAYGDDGAFTVTVTVTDDDGGVAVATATVEVANALPVVTLSASASAVEGTGIVLSADATDPGSDDLSFEWDFGDGGPGSAGTHFNDGAGPDPFPSPLGEAPFAATDEVAHAYGDDGAFTVTVTVRDDDGGTVVRTTVVEVANAPPAVVDRRLLAQGTLSLRIAGEKWHDVRLAVSEDAVETASVGVVRMPGDPDEQTASLTGLAIDVSTAVAVVLVYTPDDDPVNGTRDGANPVWVTWTDASGRSVRLQHAFNVRRPNTWTWVVDAGALLAESPVTFEAEAEDPGSDDLTFRWDLGDGSPEVTATVFNDGASPDPLPSPQGTFPFGAAHSFTQSFATPGPHLVTLTVTDDDGGAVVEVIPSLL